ncbi:hypothetical protein GCM10010172_45720 [Paractinoplanes ferrugineus]|uniref:Uncharacterized protein n=1 Tax=Paractinoplanes ferrugineus TaxID=113564 RepID=A0A919J9M4_9ACTN|nr:hypothetical protein [Actinoplanes ferrugineus]GIE15583.1 hypothetical protein Afe05nite_74230 [Actinoplanes ferrugineus]
MSVNDGQFIESFDSIRTGRDATGPFVRQEESLQAFADVLVTLALGRDIVVPQSYAFDSLAFLKVADVLVAARDDLFRRKPGVVALPIRLHLYRQPSYRHATAAMLTRMDTRDGGFVSSLLDYGADRAGSGAAAGAARRLLAGDSEPMIGLAPPEIRTPFRRVWTELAGSRSADAAADDFPSLETAMPALADPASAVRRVLSATGLDRRDGFPDLIDAVSALVRSGAPDVFRVRSHVHSGHPWPGDPDGRPAEVIVGGPDTLRMVRECVDTLYNARLAGSAGVASSAFSTSVASAGGADALARATLAQEVALAFYRVGRGEPGPGAEPGLPPTFDLVVRNGADAPPADVLATFGAMRERIEDAFRVLLELRGTADFQRGSAELRAVPGGLDGNHLRPLERHIRLVASALAGVVTIETEGGFLRTGLVTGGAALGGALSHGWLAAALGAGAPELWVELHRRIRAASRRDRVARAIAHVVQVTRQPEVVRTATTVP